MHRRSFVVGAVAGVAAPMLKAQTLPAGPVRIVVGFPPGGGTDALARLLGQKLAQMWNTSVVVENMAGAAGVTAAEYVSTQPGDGTTLIMAHINSHALATAMGTKLKYDPIKSFTPLALVGITPNLLVCNADQKSKNVKQLVAECKDNPGRISFATAGHGSAQHFALEMFNLRARIATRHVPYKGSGPALTDLMAGQVNYSFDTMTAATPHVKAGRLIALAQTRTKRAPSFADVPTMAQQGFVEFDASTWYGLMAPARLPESMARRMNEDINRAMAMPDVKERMDQYGAEGGGGSAERFARFIEQEQGTWSAVAILAKLKPNA